VRVLACAVAGQELKYHLCVENCSPAAAHHVLVRNPMPKNARFVRATPEPTSREPELQWRLGTLAGGARCEIMLVLAPTGTDDVKNCARVQFEHGQCVLTRIARAAPPPGVPVGPPAPLPPVPTKPAPPLGTAKLALTISGPKQELVNQPATYTITISNPGTAAAGSVLVTGLLPANTKFLSASEGGRFHANQVAWLLGTLAPGASRTVQLVLRADAAGELCTKATALADPGLKADGEACTVFQGAPAMHCGVVDRNDPIPVGGTTSYVILVWNQGQLPVTNIRIKAVVPREMALVRAKGPADNKLGEQTKEGQIVLYDPLASLEPGGKREYEVYVKAVRPGDVRFKVEMTADQLKPGGPVHREESTRIYQEENGGSPPPAAAPQTLRRWLLPFLPLTTAAVSYPRHDCTQIGKVPSGPAI
jgi:uncharacterized repeat protein (TIGR01451 family)